MQKQPSLDFDFYLLIPYYNNLSGLISSLQNVSYDPVKYSLLIVDDGSAEPLQQKVLAPHIPDKLAVEIIRLPENKGITHALNTGLQWLKGKTNFHYVARLDCGDICKEDRFRRQVEYMQQHPDIDLLGSWCIFKNFSSGAAYQYITPTEHKQIMRGMYFRNIFIHPTVMWRASVTAGPMMYPEKFPHAEDYGFFYEILNKGKGAVIPENLVICEINNKGLSLHFRKEQLKSRMHVVKEYGKNKMLSLMGICKLWVLMVIPYGLVLQTKRIIYGIKLLCVI